MSSPTHLLLEERLERVRRGEIDRVCGRLRLTPDDEIAIESLSHRIVNKIMHTPVMVLKAASGDPESAGFVEAVHRLLNLGTSPNSQR